MSTTPVPPGSAGRVPGIAGSVTVFGVPVRFHFTFWLVVIWLTVLGAGGRQSVAGAALFVAGLFLSILLHEAGHAWMARRFGIGTHEIVMLPIGGLARLERQPRAGEEFWVAFAGPLVNFLLGALLLGAAYWSGAGVSAAHWRQATDANLLSRLAVANLVLALFNLLPAFPMDGGRVLRSLLAEKRPYEDATRITARMGTGIAALLALAGLLQANFLLLFVALFTYVGAMQESMAASAQALMQGAKVREAMVTDFRTLSHGDTIRDAAELLLATSQQDFPVLAGPRVTGLLSRSHLLRALASEGPDGYVASAMDREFPRLDPDMDLSEAAGVLGGGTNCALVLEEDRLVGMLTAENLSEYLVLKKLREARMAGKEETSRRDA
ncbi:MAG: site-2 protease family protein [Bryobacteraceae bacterium]